MLFFLAGSGLGLMLANRSSFFCWSSRYCFISATLGLKLLILRTRNLSDGSLPIVEKCCCDICV